MGFWSVLAPIITQLGSSGLSAWSQERTNQQQADLASDQMEFQKYMSNTAHQREVDDLRAAGLNPILSAKFGGASTPAGAMPMLKSPLEGLGSNMNNAVSQAFQNPLIKQQTQTQASQASVNSAVAAKEREQAKVSAELAQQEKMRTEVMKTTLIDRKAGEKYKYWLQFFNPMSYLPKTSSSMRE